MSFLVIKLCLGYGFLLALVRVYTRLTTVWCKSKTSLAGKTVIVTGANSGIGFETALEFAKRGARVILACRNPQKAEKTRSTIVDKTGNSNVVVRIIDLASFASVRNFVKEIEAEEDRLDILVNNAGILAPPRRNQKSLDGRELVMQVNHYSPFLLTNLLLDLLKKTPHSRIVNISSIIARWCKNLEQGSNGMKEECRSGYTKSKLCVILITKELSKRLKKTNVTVYSLHPGCVRTEIMSYAKKLERMLDLLTFYSLGKTPLEGAQTTLYCSLAQNIKGLSGEHFEDCRPVPAYTTVSEDLARKVWDISENVVKLKNNWKC